MQDDNKILISVLMCCYNGEPYLHRAFNAFKNQTWQRNFEVVFIDNGSTDNSSVLVKAFKDENPHIPVQIFRLEKNDLSEAWKTLLNRAIGEYVLSNDADDWLEPNAIELFVNKINETHADIIAGLYQWRNEEEKITRKLKYSKKQTKWGIPDDHAVLRKKEIIRAMPEMPVEYICWGDRWNSLQQNRLTNNVAFIYDVVYNFFIHSKSSFHAKKHGYDYYLENFNEQIKLLVEIYNQETNLDQKKIICYVALKMCYTSIIMGIGKELIIDRNVVQLFLDKLKTSFSDYRKNSKITLLRENGFCFRARASVYAVYLVDVFEGWWFLLFLKNKKIFNKRQLIP